MNKIVATILAGALPGLITLAVVDPAMAEVNTKVHRSADGQIMMTTFCENLDSRVSEIQNWSQHVSGRKCESPELFASGQDECTANISACVPEHVRKYHGLTSAQAGPNCWNTALVMAGLIPFMRETTSDEWAFYLGSPLCRALGKNETKKPGDIGSVEVRAKEGRPTQVHGFVHVSDNLVYAKMGINAHAPFELQQFEEMTKFYPINSLYDECESTCGPKSLEGFLSKEELAKVPTYLLSSKACSDRQLSQRKEIRQACLRMKDMLAANKEDCQKKCAPTSLHYYRCEKFETYFEKLPAATQSKYQEIHHLADVLECEKQDRLMSTSPLAPENKMDIANTLAVIAKFFDQEMSKQPKSPEDKVLLSRLALRLEAAVSRDLFWKNKELTQMIHPE